tara:strand:- start:88 stop:585 length:498 start_codon:yes stop_codon:yes gene_type:complete
MILNFKNLKKIIKKNGEVTVLFLLILITILSTKFYNDKKKEVNNRYKIAINNIYFQKSIGFIFDNLSPGYQSIDHKISKNETFDKILENYLVPDSEITKIKKILKNDVNLNNLKTDQIIKISIYQSTNKKVTKFLFPISRTKKIQLIRNLETDMFEKKNNYHKFK